MLFFVDVVVVFDSFDWIDDSKTAVEFTSLVTILVGTSVELTCKYFVVSGMISWPIVIDSLDQKLA